MEFELKTGDCSLEEGEGEVELMNMGESWLGERSWSSLDSPLAPSINSSHELIGDASRTCGSGLTRPRVSESDWAGASS